MDDLITINNNNLENGLPPIYYKTSDEKEYYHTDLSEFSDDDYNIIKSIPIGAEQYVKIQVGGILDDKSITKINKGLDAGIEVDRLISKYNTRKYPDDKWSTSMSTSHLEIFTRYFLPLLITPQAKTFNGRDITGLQSLQNLLSRIIQGNNANKFALKVNFIDDGNKIGAIFNALTPNRKKEGYSLSFMIQALGMRVFCINTNCYRYAIGNGNKTAKQRQECTTCKARESDDEIIMGYKVVLSSVENYEVKDPDDDKKTITKKRRKVIITEEPIIFVCPRFCVNNEEYITEKIMNDYSWWVSKKKKLTPTEIEEKDDAYKKIKPVEVILKNGNISNLHNTKNEKYFYCPIERSKYALCPAGIYDVDHINGNHFDNTYMNVQTLCKICHEIKGLLAGDKGSGKGVAADDDDEVVVDKSLATKIKKEVSVYLNVDAFKTFLIENYKKYQEFCQKYNLPDYDTMYETEIKIKSADGEEKITVLVMKEYLIKLFEKKIDIIQKGKKIPIKNKSAINNMKKSEIIILYTENYAINGDQ